MDPTPVADIAFICAMPMELEPLIRKLDLEESPLGAGTVHSGTMNDKRVVAVVTGMGTELATQGTTRLLDAVEVDRVVVVGITGAVENETPIGTLVLPEGVVNGATGGEYHPAPMGEGTHAGTMWTTDTLITDVDEI